MKTVDGWNTGYLCFCSLFCRNFATVRHVWRGDGVKAAKRKKKLKFKPIIKEFRVSTRSEAVQVCN